MKIADNQISELYSFTRQHFVYHYDVQTELVDHLANDIEQIWVAKPQLTFKQARDISFKKFGVFGFMNVVEEKQNAMSKRYRKILWRFTKEWFSVPKIILTGLLFMLFYTILQLKYASEIIFVSIFCLVIIDFYFLFKNRYKRKKERIKKEKIYLLESMIGATKNGFSVLVFVNVFNMYNLIDVSINTLPIYWLFSIAFFCTLTCIVFYITDFVIPSKAEELLAETYPEYKIL